MNKLKLEDVSKDFDCGLKNYGCMRDTIDHFYYEFKSGTYVIEGKYVTGKSIYCFPWINKKHILKLENCLQLWFNSLQEIGAIIIIPTISHHAIEKSTDKYTVIEME